jgi:hypothetical protein
MNIAVSASSMMTVNPSASIVSMSIWPSVPVPGKSV